MTASENERAAAFTAACDERGLPSRLLLAVRADGRAQTLADTPGLTAEDHEASLGFGCHYIAPQAAAITSALHESGIVIDPDGTPIDHHWVTLTDGTILDVTWLRLITPDASEHARYVTYGELGEDADPHENPAGYAAWLAGRRLPA